jgi:hypothetical protein
MRRFKSAAHVHRFVSVHGLVRNLFSRPQLERRNSASMEPPVRIRGTAIFS